MTPRLAKLLMGLGVVVLAILGFLLFNKYSPLPYYTAHPKDYAQCMAARGTFSGEGGINSCIFKNQIFYNSKNNSDAASLKDFVDRENGYSLKYPGKIFAEIDSSPVVRFLGTKAYDSTTLVHSINVEHCDLSGRPEGCTPQTTDVSITFTPIDQSFQKVTEAAKKEFEGLDNVKIGQRDIPYFMSGAEGEGIYYYFLELAKNRTLLVSRTFIDESILSKYQTEKEFIRYSHQTQIFEDIIKSLKIN